MDFEELMQEVESAVQDTPPATKAHHRHTIMSHVDKQPSSYSAKTTPLPVNSKSDLDDLLDIVDGPDTISGSKRSSNHPTTSATSTSHIKQPTSSTSNNMAFSASSKRCNAVLLAGSNVKHGVSTSSVNPQACSNLRCNECDFLVVQFEHTKWADSADYMFFRENAPNEAKLRRKMESAQGAFAYACQCKWATVTTKASPDSLHVKWCCAGH
ncbi:hypothetical protein H257_15885 [Aphanomyces astaci]|uniref:Cilia- and flagella-associated protein 418 n=1 Tax=Aphanomyces astaci TaxID=112090 RepID=W4FL04_APHAT|nr:hypothetical protein H257_15885 [Aphanomyces astaci]ETV68155.1 hypothetical protein H257_15885 [Aphanomyces astaci]|eukprot:XP_009842454.1 hypothetical protein H257_15885 [Aphanomyces astaci]